MGYQIHQCGRNDIEPLHHFGLQFPELKVSSQCEFMTLDELKSAIMNSGSVTYLARQDNEIIGFCLGSTGDPDRCSDGTQACLIYVAVSLQHRRRGIATALLRAVIEQLKQNGVSYIYTWACPTSGLVRICEQIGMKAGRSCVWMDMQI